VRLIFKLLLWMASTGMLLGLVAMAGVYFFFAPQLPSTEHLRDMRLQVPLRVYSADGKLMAEYGEKKREPLSYGQIPRPLILAFLAAEDDRFFEHPGVDYQGLARAALQLLTTGQRSQGGSTITMQVARNFFLSPEKTYTRKLNEILLALKIERELSKQELLELYLNKIYLGHRAYGIAAAGQVYYGKGLDELNLAQLAMIAGLPKAPSKYNPISNPQRAKQRRDYVLGRMRGLNWIDQASYDQALAQPVSARLHPVEIELDAPYVAEMVRNEMVQRFGEEAYHRGYSVFTSLDSRLQPAAERALRDNLHAYDERHGYRGAEQRLQLLGSSELDAFRALREIEPIADLRPALVLGLEGQRARIYIKGVGRAVLEWEGLSWAAPYLNENHRGSKPKQASDVLRRGDLIRVRASLGERGAARWRLAQLPQLESALVALDPKDGAIKALVGGYDFYRSKFNRVTQAKRQPGSGFKPVIYSAALEAGFSAATLINDSPVMLAPGQAGASQWRPENYSGRFYGPTRLRQALARSQNMVSIRLLQEMGLKQALEHSRNFGFEPQSLPRNFTLALGTGESNPLQMARAYAVLANGGFLVEPYLIQRIEEQGVGVVYRADPLTACPECEEALAAGQVLTGRAAPRTLSPQNHFLMNSLLRDVIRSGTATDAKQLGRDDLAGKTGTTNQQRDAWFNGFHPQLVAVVWSGFDDMRPMGKGETGGKVSLPTWIAFMAEALKGVPEQPLQLPGGMYSLLINPASGQPAAPGQRNAIKEYFRVGAPLREGTASPSDPSSPDPELEPLLGPSEAVSEELF
jgi:penicillin-binding protein 1A